MTMEETILDNPSRRQRQQLSFEVGLNGQPDMASIKVGGNMPIHRDIKQGERVHLQITGMDGELLVSYDCECESVGFKTKKDKFGDVESIERLHTVVPG